MPRIRQRPDDTMVSHPRLVSDLVAELKSDHEFGQPRIEETEFSTGAIRVRVLWDKWDAIAMRERPEVIQQAYEKVEGKAFRDRITLAIGLTFPEAYELGYLPYSLVPAVRKTDSVTEAQCYQVMKDLGASKLLAAGKPVLRFASREEADKYRARLEELLPGSHCSSTRNQLQENHEAAVIWHCSVAEEGEIMRHVDVTPELKMETILLQMKGEDVVLKWQGRAVALLSEFDDDELYWYQREHDPEFVASIAEARKQAAEGRTFPHDELKKRLGIE